MKFELRWIVIGVAALAILPLTRALVQQVQSDPTFGLWDGGQRTAKSMPPLKPISDNSLLGILANEPITLRPSDVKDRSIHDLSGALIWYGLDDRYFKETLKAYPSGIPNPFNHDINVRLVDEK
jgi:hypothetical protein